jgi:polysaccharide biosynthesis/export protein
MAGRFQLPQYSNFSSDAPLVLSPSAGLLVGQYLNREKDPYSGRYSEKIILNPSFRRGANMPGQKQLSQCVSPGLGKFRPLLVLNVQPRSNCRSFARDCDFPMMRSVLLRYRSLLVLVAALAALGFSVTRAAAKDVPEDLVQYVKEAQKLGLSDQQIRDNAVKAGWPAASVDQAVTMSHPSHRKPAEGSQAATPNDSSQTPPAAPEARTPDQGSPDGYRIGAGDVLQISVWKDPDTSVPSAVVRPDGKISMPLLKEVRVAGLTPQEAELLITKRLAQFIRGADVTVVVSKINSTKAYVIGAVKKEGPISLPYRMTILQALSEAGGLTDYAKRKKIYLLRTENGKQFRFPFNYEAVIKGQQMGENIPVIPGDTIVVPH